MFYFIFIYFRLSEEKRNIIKDEIEDTLKELPQEDGNISSNLHVFCPVAWYTPFWLDIYAGQ